MSLPRPLLLFTTGLAFAVILLGASTGGVEALSEVHEKGFVHRNLRPDKIAIAITKAFLEAGIHVLCEKPFSADPGEAEAALREIESCGVFFMEAFMYRCHPWLARVRSLSGLALGDPLTLHYYDHAMLHAWVRDIVGVVLSAGAAVVVGAAVSATVVVGSAVVPVAVGSVPVVGAAWVVAVGSAVVPVLGSAVGSVVGSPVESPQAVRARSRMTGSLVGVMAMINGGRRRSEGRRRL